MFERFTDRARRVIVLAQEEARTLQHNYIGTEHLLLGLIREGDGVAAKALASKGVELDATRKQVEEMIGKGNAVPNGHIPFTPHARQVLELSLREALQLGHSYIGTEHILLGLIREGEGVGTQVLIKMGVDLGDLRTATIDMMPRAPPKKVLVCPSRVTCCASKNRTMACPTVNRIVDTISLYPSLSCIHTLK